MNWEEAWTRAFHKWWDDHDNKCMPLPFAYFMYKRYRARVITEIAHGNPDYEEQLRNLILVRREYDDARRIYWGKRF